MNLNPRKEKNWLKRMGCKLRFSEMKEYGKSIHQKQMGGQESKQTVVKRTTRHKHVDTGLPNMKCKLKIKAKQVPMQPSDMVEEKTYSLEYRVEEVTQNMW